MICFLFLFIYGLGNLHADRMFRTSREAESGGLDAVKSIEAPGYLLLFVSRRYFCLVPPCYMWFARGYIVSSNLVI